MKISKVLKFTILSLVSMLIGSGIALAAQTDWQATYNTSIDRWVYGTVGDNDIYWGNESTDRYQTNNEIKSDVLAGNESYTKEYGVAYFTTYDVDNLGRPSISGGSYYKPADDINFTTSGDKVTIEIGWYLKPKEQTNSVGVAYLTYPFKQNYNWNDHGSGSDHAIFANWAGGYYSSPIEALDPITIGY